MGENGNRPFAMLMHLMPRSLRTAVEREATDRLEEIRIRTGKPVQLIYGEKEKLLPFIVREGFCTELLETLSEHALFVKQEELEEGFLTVRGGCRVGIAGRYMLRDGKIRFAEAASCNIRIAKEHKGAADILMPHLCPADGMLCSVLIFSPPGAGKTTLLRDAARQLSDGDTKRRGRKVAVADERGEISGGCTAAPLLDVGLRTDVTSGCKKAEAIERLVRSMSPEIIVTDELGNMADAEAAMYAAASGTALLASAHAGSFREAMRKPHLRFLIENGCFGKLFLLQRRETCHTLIAAGEETGEE